MTGPEPRFEPPRVPDAVDLGADRRDSPGAAQHPPRHALTPLGGRLLTPTCLRCERQGCCISETAVIMVERLPWACRTGGLHINCMGRVGIASIYKWIRTNYI